LTEFSISEEIKNLRVSIRDSRTTVFSLNPRYPPLLSTPQIKFPLQLIIIKSPNASTSDQSQTIIPKLPNPTPTIATITQLDPHPGDLAMFPVEAGVTVNPGFKLVPDAVTVAVTVLRVDRGERDVAAVGVGVEKVAERRVKEE
jgi:hypothetical protein